MGLFIKKKLFILLLLFCFQFVYSQKEVYFNDYNIDKKDIKISPSIQGVNLSMDALRLIPDKNVVTGIHYFHENRIGSTFSLYKSAGLTNAFNNYPVADPTFEGNEWSYRSTGELKYFYSLAFEGKIEPRWYFTYRRRYRMEKNIQTNAGWFLALPLTLSVTILNQPGSMYFPKKWLPGVFSIKMLLFPTIGYRDMFFHKRLFWEISLGYSPFQFWYTPSATNSFGFWNSLEMNHFWRMSHFYSDVKISYVF